MNIDAEKILIYPELFWKPVEEVSRLREEAILGEEGDSVRFSLDSYPTCYRRGVYRLLIEVCAGRNHHKWGCFDEQDQPVRWYHLQGNAKSEAQAIACVLWRDRYSKK